MKAKLTKFLIILNIFLSIALIISLIYFNNRLSLKRITKEIHAIYGKDYEVTIFDVNNNKYVVSATIPEELLIDPVDYNLKVNQLTTKLKSYKPNKNISKLILNIGYHTEDTTYYNSTNEINLTQ